MPDDEEEQNPLKTLAWEKGDSLAPPCGSSVSIIHAMLEFASVNRNDVLYDVRLRRFGSLKVVSFNVSDI